MPKQEIKKVNIETLGAFILAYLMKNRIEVNHFKLQKLLYYVQAWHLVNFDKHPLFDDEPEAWVNGPVYRKIFDKLKHHKGHVLLTMEDKELDTWFEQSKSELDLSELQWEYLEAAIKRFGFLSHEKLIMSTHLEAPWNDARKGLGLFDYSGNVISHESMYDFYSSRVKKK